MTRREYNALLEAVSDGLDYGCDEEQKHAALKALIELHSQAIDPPTRKTRFEIMGWAAFGGFLIWAPWAGGSSWGR